ncbi:MAG: AAA family ATPase [Candidatus Hodarchaeales archaeon]
MNQPIGMKTRFEYHLRFIGITGRMGAGKTTVARLILTEDENFVLLRIAGKLKQIVQELELPYTRDMLQRVATFFREIDHDIWVKNALREIDEVIEENPTIKIVVDDVRFQNEANLLRKRGFVIVKVKTNIGMRKNRIETRDGLSITDRTWQRWQVDPTEEEIDTIVTDYSVINDGDMNGLLIKIQDLIRNAK